jgi:RNA polymerase sigma-70 factor, ECF subfamily
LTSVAQPVLVLAAASEPKPSDVRRETDRLDVEAAQRGESEAFDRLVERYQRQVYRLCYRYVNNHHDANDMTQEAFVKAFRALSRFRGDSGFATWLYRIAVNTCLNFKAAPKPEKEPLSDTMADLSPDASDQMETDERSRLVREAVTRLPEKQRATLILKVYHELSHQEVAEIVGASVGTVKANLFHALGNLRKMLPADAAGRE